MPFTSDRQAGKKPFHDFEDVYTRPEWRTNGAWTIGNPSQLRCPHAGCDQLDSTHVVDVVWEPDPREDRRWVRLEVRCENGHGYLLLIRNHAGVSRIEYQLLDGEVSPFAEGSRW